MAEKLTAAIITGMTVGQELADPDCKGLRVVCNLRGRTFFYRFRDGQKLKQIKIGAFGPVTLSDARKEVIKLQAARIAGIDPAAQRKSVKKLPVEKKVLTVGDLIQSYLAEHIDVMRQAKGAAEVRRFLMSPALKALRATPAAEVTRPMAYKLIVELRANAPVLAGQIKTELKATYAHAANSGELEIPIAPFDFRLAGTVAKKRDRHLSDRELGLLVPWMSNYSTTVRDVLMITLLCGVRSGEVCGMRRNEVSEATDGLIWTIPGDKSKNGQRFRVMLPTQAAAIVRNRMEAHTDWLFPRRDGKGPIGQKVVGVETWTHSPNCQHDRFENRNRCPVDSWTPHDLRRTCRTGLSKLGCPVEIGEAILNHVPAGVRQNYDHYKFDAEKRIWLQRWGDYLSDLLKKNSPA